jgi:hypothetical protein
VDNDSGSLNMVRLVDVFTCNSGRAVRSSPLAAPRRGWENQCCSNRSKKPFHRDASKCVRAQPREDARKIVGNQVDSATQSYKLTTMSSATA